jgi:hypothetical protein
MAKRTQRKQPGDLRKLRQVLWEVIEMVQHYLLEPHAKGEPVKVDELCRLANTIGQLGNTYARVMEHTFDERAEELLNEVESLRQEVREGRISA